MAEVSFFVAALIALLGAGGTVLLRNPFYAVLALVCHLLSLAALFLLLRAEFIAAAQVVVYAGAVMVLYVFVVAYVGSEDRPTGGQGPSLPFAAPLFALALFVEVSLATLGSGLKAIDGDGAPFQPGFGGPGAIGELLLTRFLLPFEVASYLLLIAAVGAVILARRRRGLETPAEAAHEARRLAVGDLFRLDDTVGTQAESVGVIADRRERDERRQEEGW